MAEKANRIEGRLKTDTLDNFNAIKDACGWSTTRGGDDLCLRLLLATYHASPLSTDSPKIAPDTVLAALNCSPEESEEIHAAMALPHLNFWTLLRQGLLRQVRVENTQAQRLHEYNGQLGDTKVGVDGIARRTNRLRGSAYLRIQQCVEGLMQQNMRATTALEVCYITKGIVADATKAHSAEVARYFDEHKDELEAHHQDFGFTSEKDGIRHNRMRAAHMRKQYAQGNGSEGIKEGVNTILTENGEKGV